MADKKWSPDIPAINQMIETAIAKGCAREKRDNDVKYDYQIIGHNMIFAIKSKYARVRRYVEGYLLHNLPKLRIALHLVCPDPLHENMACFRKAHFDLYPISDGIDPNHSYTLWKPFNDKHAYTIRCYAGIRKESELGAPHLNKLKENGYNYVADDHVENNWELFEAAYKAAYGCTPLEAVTAFYSQER